MSAEYERLSDDAISFDLRCMQPGNLCDYERALLELQDRRAADRERETRQATHSAVCWQWHIDCAVARIEKAMARIIELRGTCDPPSDRFLGVHAAMIALENAMRGE